MEELPFIDTLSGDYDADIHRAHREAREQSFCARTPDGLVFLCYEDVLSLLRDRRWHELGEEALTAAGITDGPLLEWFREMMSKKEGEEHARLRRLVSRAFTPRRVEAMRPLMRATAHDLIDRFVEQGSCEFVSSFAAPYPVRVISGLLGVPAEDFDRFHAWSQDLSLAFGSRLETERARVEAALVSLNDYVDGLLAARARQPEDDLISALVAVEEEGDRLSHGELRALVTVLIFGAQDTTQCQLACAAATFIDHPDQWDRLGEEPGWSVSAAEEVLRFEPAGSGAPRVASEDIEYRGLSLSAGTIVLPSGPAANRDPKVYPDPDRFDMTREHAEPMLTFGGGDHYCLGASLARIEIQEALSILSKRLPHLAADGEVRWRRGSLIRGPEWLPVRFGP
ncbi:MAG: cytochrome [Deltaproteobacteria bacterium]|nr:cytochrome [Deltaproteobacteria bacterium]